MKFVLQLERYQKIDALIQQQKTGTPREFSNKLGISRSHLYRLLEILKDKGAPIKYDRKLLTFCYSEPYKLNITPTTHLDTDKMDEISGGFYKNFIPSPFMRRYDFNFTPIFTTSNFI